MENHGDLTHKRISRSSLESPLGCRYAAGFQPCPCILLSQHFLVMLSLGSSLTGVKAFQTTFTSLLFHTLAVWDNRAPKWNHRDEMEVGQRA